MIPIIDQLNAYAKAANATHEDPQTERGRRRQIQAYRLVVDKPMFAREIAQKMGTSIFSVYQYMNILLHKGKVDFKLVKGSGTSPQRQWYAK